MDALVSTEWLQRELGASDLRVVDATWLMPGDTRDARTEYESGHIPGAVFMDLADLVDSGNPVDNMAPPPEKFASRMARSVWAMAAGSSCMTTARSKARRAVGGC